MNHHLKHALKRCSNSLKYFSDMKWIEVKNKIEKAFEDPEIMKQWDDIFDYCKQYKSDTGGHQKPLISCSPVNNTMGINKNTYLLESDEGVLLNVDGLSEPARKLVPAYFNDSLVMGAFLSGMHNKSLDAAHNTFQDLRNYEKANLGKNYEWFVNNVLTDKKRLYSQEDIVNKNFWENKHLIEDLKLFYKEIEYQDSFQIWKDDPFKKELHELRDNIKDFVKEYSYVRKSNTTPYPTFNIEYHLETDLFQNPDLLKIKEDIQKVSKYLTSCFDLDFGKKNEEKVEKIRDEKMKNVKKMKP